MGKTFGLSIAEFSIKNKPIITCPCGDIEHIKILKDKAILYRSKDELINIFQRIRTFSADWNCYRQYTPENVMKLFKELIFEKNSIYYFSGHVYIKNDRITTPALPAAVKEKISALPCPPAPAP